MNLEGEFQTSVRAAAEDRTPLVIRSGGSKSFYGRQITGDDFCVGEHRGIIDYSPTELVITARAGTPLDEIEAALEKEGQVLAFEPPHFSASATLGGAIACGLSGPRRPYAGAARDFVLGVKCLNGKGELLRFGGQVMKNVAGYDVARTLTGSLGTLAVLLDVSLRVMPRPETETTLCMAASPAEAVQKFNQWARLPLPLSGACHVDGRLYLRLAGNAPGVRSAAEIIGGDPVAAAATFWAALREQALPFFQNETPLWRLSLPPATPPLALEGGWLIDWGGAQRWLKTGLPGETIRQAAVQAGGHATRFRDSTNRRDVFHPLPPALLALHQRLKQSFDPAGVLNPGKMYAGL